MKRLFFDMKKCLFLMMLLSLGLMGCSGDKKKNENSSCTLAELTAPNYCIYPTQNMFIFLRLDTRNGKVDMVQWSTNNNRLVEPLSTVNLVSTSKDEIPGRFILSPTTNMFNFVMLDQVDGRTWQVQWSFESANCGIFPIQ